ncbi:hypothetical protein DdX_11824 [Ditylenchus destructor]|uniref:Uncharacterized protein n=1 Tax=Ditylenchus destructor TaxID=166010 RepID=A0AAD4MZD9_9BILA|nr:hypothetical protein DdX_11824 [Ditylenchus destructor]
MIRDRVVDFAALMEERSSSVSEDSSSQAEDEDSRDTVAPDAANVPDIHHGPVIQATQVIFGANLLNRYNTDPDFAVKCKMIIALAFVNPPDLKDAFHLLCEVFENEDEINPLIEWFEKYYIGAERRRGNRIVQLEPRFPPEMWSVYQRTLDGASRTNNYAEAANRSRKFSMAEINSICSGLQDVNRKTSAGSTKMPTSEF